MAEYIYSKGYQVVITGSKDDVQIANKLQKLISFKTLNLIGKTNLQEIINLINLSKFIICGNTGVLHIAAALVIPTIAIHGPTDPNKWGPWGKGHIVIKSNLNCAPCSYLGFEYGCKEKKCLKEIKSKKVIEAVKLLL